MTEACQVLCQAGSKVGIETYDTCTMYMIAFTMVQGHIWSIHVFCSLKEAFGSYQAGQTVITKGYKSLHCEARLLFYRKKRYAWHCPGGITIESRDYMPHPSRVSPLHFWLKFNSC